jgi:hypothetical protein
MSHDCKIIEKLQLAHEIAHDCMSDLSLLQLAEAHGLAEKLIDFLNEIEQPDGVKLLALIEVLGVGTDEMVQHEKILESENESGEGTPTVN